jgi:hypothetical protein
MTAIQQMRMGLRVASFTLEDALSETDLAEMARLAVQAANRILESSRLPRPEPEPQYCPNHHCGRRITDRDPIFAGFCSTKCRESFNMRRSVTAESVGA